MFTTLPLFCMYHPQRRCLWSISPLKMRWGQRFHSVSGHTFYLCAAILSVTNLKRGILRGFNSLVALSCWIISSYLHLPTCVVVGLVQTCTWSHRHLPFIWHLSLLCRLLDGKVCGFISHPAQDVQLLLPEISLARPIRSAHLHSRSSNRAARIPYGFMDVLQ